VAQPLTGAPSTSLSPWNFIPWKTAEKQVRRLQMRIAKAIREGKKGKVKALQRLLTLSFYAKCLAIKRVVSNKGAKTPGVDDILWSTSHQRMQAVKNLKRRGYKSLPLRRIHIPKKDPSRGSRPLSIPMVTSYCSSFNFLLGSFHSCLRNSGGIFCPLFQCLFLIFINRYPYLCVLSR